MLGTHMAIANSRGFFCCERQCLFALRGKWYPSRRGNAFAPFNSVLDLGLNRVLGTQFGQQTLRRAIVFPKEAEKKVFRLDSRAAVLAGLKAGEENGAASLLGEAFEHNLASLFRGYGIRQLEW